MLKATPITRFMRVSQNCSVIAAIERLGNSCIVTVYARMRSDRYRFIFSSIVGSPNVYEDNEFASFYLSDDGNLLMLSGLTDRTFRIYQQIDGAYVLTTEFQSSSYTDGGHMTADGILNLESNSSRTPPVLLVRYRQCSAGEYSNGTACLKCIDPQCDLCLNSTLCVRCYEGCQIMLGTCVVTVIQRDWPLIIVSTLMLMMIVSMVAVNFYCNFENAEQENSGCSSRS